MDFTFGRQQFNNARQLGPWTPPVGTKFIALDLDLSSHIDPAVQLEVAAELSPDAGASWPSGASWIIPGTVQPGSVLDGLAPNHVRLAIELDDQHGAPTDANTRIRVRVAPVGGKRVVIDSGTVTVQ